MKRRKKNEDQMMGYFAIFIAFILVLVGLDFVDRMKKTHK